MYLLDISSMKPSNLTYLLYILVKALLIDVNEGFYNDALPCKKVLETGRKYFFG
jgi:hypothetical protein